MSYQPTTIRDYLTKVNHYYSDSIKGIENWYIGHNCIFKSMEQLLEYEQKCYEEDVNKWKNAFSKYCLENNIPTADAKLFEEFFNFDLSPYKKELFSNDAIELIRQLFYSPEKIFKNFFEVCHPDMLESSNIVSSI